MLDAKYTHGQRVRHIHSDAWGTVFAVAPLTLPDGEQYSWQYLVHWDSPNTEEALLSAAPAPEYWRSDPEHEFDTLAAFVSPDGDFMGQVKWDGCTHYWTDNTNNDATYRHICDIDAEIARLLALKAAALTYFGWGEFGVAEKRA